MPSYVRGSDNFDSLASVKPSLLAEYEVTGSAVTSIDFSGLDINTHKSYRVEMELVNATASLANIYSFINGDTTLTNYYSQYAYANGTGLSGSRVNTPQLTQMTASQSSSLYVCNITRSNGYPFLHTVGSFNDASTIQTLQNITKKTATVTNITQLTFTASVASSIGVGSKIRIYRGDV